MSHTKHDAKIAIFIDSTYIYAKFLQNHPHFSFFLAEILLNACNFGEI